MAYVAPVISASSLTFSAQRGLRAHLDALVAANGSLTADQVSLINQTFIGSLACRRASVALDNFISGQPIDKSALNAELLSAATAAAVILALLNEAAVLVEGDATSISTVVDKTPAGRSSRRVFS